MSNRPRNRKTNRVHLTLRVDSATFEAIENLRAIATGTSQSEIVDLWGKIYATALAYVKAEGEIEVTATYQELVELLR